MEYNEFIDEIENHILENTKWNISEENYKLYRDGDIGTSEEELSMIRSTNIKYNHLESDTMVGDFIVLKAAEAESNSTLCRFSVKNLYNAYVTDGWDKVDYIIDDNLKWAVNADVNAITDHMTDYAYIHEHLIIRPINYTDNRYELKDCIFERVGDIALVLYLLLYDDERGLGTIKVPKSIFEEWKKERSDIWQEALVNTNVWAPPRMYMRERDMMDPPYDKGAFMAINGKLEKIDPLFAPVVETTRKTNGAVAMFYPGVQKKISEICGGNYYVAFTSIHDVRIHPEGSIPPRQILQSLKEINKGFNKPQEILSRKVFFYNVQKGTLEVKEL